MALEAVALHNLVYSFAQKFTQIYKFIILTFVCPCIVSIIVNDDLQNYTVLAYLFIPNQL
jgi:hypothetical protein